MRPLRYSINVTLDGCYDHMAVTPDEEMHRYHADSIARADTLLFGRVTYAMMEEAWREPGRTGVMSDWMVPWMMPFAKTIDAAKKVVVSKTLDHVDWNAELIDLRRDDLAEAVSQLKRGPGGEIFVGGVTLAHALTELGLIDTYELMVHPRLVGHGPTLFAGLARPVDLKFVGHHVLGTGAIVLRYERNTWL